MLVGFKALMVLVKYLGYTHAEVRWLLMVLVKYLCYTHAEVRWLYEGMTI